MIVKLINLKFLIVAVKIQAGREYSKKGLPEIVQWYMKKTESKEYIKNRFNLIIDPLKNKSTNS